MSLFTYMILLALRTCAFQLIFETAKTLSPEQLAELLDWEFKQCQTTNADEYIEKVTNMLVLLQYNVKFTTDMLDLDAQSIQKDTPIAEFLTTRAHELELQKKLFETTSGTVKAKTTAAVKSSVIRCKRCGNTDSDSIENDVRQARSLDEGMSVFFCCQKCKYRWTQK